MGTMSGGRTNVLCELPSLAARLQARYPGVRIVEAFTDLTAYDEPQQTIRYQAPLALLKQYNLVTDWMLAHVRDGYGETELGDGFILDAVLDSTLEPGSLALSVFTGTTPREWHRRPATKKLQRIATRALKAIRTRGPR